MKIDLLSIKKDECRIIYNFEYSDDLRIFFSGTSFYIQYPENIESVPDAVLSIPFVCNVLPIVWLTDATLYIKELDKAFYDCIQEVKQGYMTMYPETEWKGSVIVDTVVPCTLPKGNNRSAMFYSGGVDSVQTLISHIEEKPDLISIWGSDIRTNNQDGWNILYGAIKEVANQLQLKSVPVKSTFREFDDEGNLDRTFSKQLKDGWWHGVKHGLGLIGHAAPLAYQQNLSALYIASSHCPEDGHVRCASNPLIDNHVRFLNCTVIHDGFVNSRQKKLHNIAEYQRNHNPILLHVCWETATGKNCCKCEKCYRTIAGLLAENAEPEMYGFEGFEVYLPQMHMQVLKSIDPNVCLQWRRVRERIVEKKKCLKKSKYWRYLRWIEQTDFDHPERIELPLSYRLKHAKGIRGKLGEFKFYQALHRMKERMRS